MDFKEFEEIVKQIDKNKYHVGRILGFMKNGELKIIKWNIFRKNMTEGEYYDSKNLVILSSERGNTIEDIKKLIQEGSNDDKK